VLELIRVMAWVSLWFAEIMGVVAWVVVEGLAVGSSWVWVVDGCSKALDGGPPVCTS
jgi:hypothetical protein